MTSKSVKYEIFVQKYLYAILDISGPFLVQMCTSYLTTFPN